MVRRLTFPALSGDEAPLLPAGLAMVAGMVVAARFGGPVGLWVGLAGLAWGGAWVSDRLGWERVVTGWLVAGIFLAGGGCRVVMEAAERQGSLRALYDCGWLEAEEPVELTGVVVQPPELAPDRIYLHLAVERVRTLRRSARVGGVVRLVVPFNDVRARLEYDAIGIDYGGRLRVLAQLRLRRQYQNPGAPPFEEILASQGIVASGWVRSPLLIERVGEGGGGVRGWLYGWRAAAIRICLRHFSQPAAGLLVASLFGNRYFLSWATAESFRVGGTFHLLVISGMHMAMIAVVVFAALGRLVRSRRGQYAGSVGVMWGYALMVGAQPAVTRSVVMLTLVLAGQYLFRPLNGANSLAAAAIMLLAWEPRDLFNPGFQVSFLTVGVMVFLTGPLAARLREIGGWRPLARTPWPPRVPGVIRWLAEVFFWNEWRFRRERRRERIRYRLFKARPALWLSRLRIQPVLVWMAMTILTTIGVQAGLLPLMIGSFHRVSLLAPLINVLEAVLVTALMGAGALYLGLTLLIGPVWVVALAPLVDWLGRVTVRVGSEVAGWRGGGWRVPDYGERAWMLYALYWVGIVGLVLLLNGWNPLAGQAGVGRRWRAWTALGLVGVVLVVGLVLVLHPTRHDYEPGRLSLTFLDVGQGDAIVITFPSGRLMMVDSGGTPRFQSSAEADEEEFVEDRLGIAEAAVLPYLWSRGIARLDWIVASHGDADHVGGFTDLVRNMAVGEAWQAAGEQGEFTAAMRSEGVPVRVVGEGCRMEIDGVRFEVLSAGGKGNNGSLVIRLSWEGRSFLLTGDIERAGELAMVRAGIDLRAEVLKVAHHGSRTSSTVEFLDRVGARTAVISAGGGNVYGHPHGEVVERLRQRGMTVLETSREGAVTISTGR